MGRVEEVHVAAEAVRLQTDIFDEYLIGIYMMSTNIN
jgi:hypothetical protein